MKRFALVVLSPLLLVVETCAAAPARNLVAIVTDDQAAWTPGCYGGREIRKPNLDRLAADGVRFANAFVHTPVCSPSRGMYMSITPGSVTLPSMLKKAGYTTGPSANGIWILAAPAVPTGMAKSSPVLWRSALITPSSFPPQATACRACSSRTIALWDWTPATRSP